MTINQMAWVASGIGILALAHTGSFPATPFADLSNDSSEQHTATLPDAIDQTSTIAHQTNIAPAQDVASAALAKFSLSDQHTPPEDLHTATLQSQPKALLAKSLNQKINLPEGKAFWRCPIAALALKPVSQALFPIKMRGCTVAYSTKADKAVQISNRLQHQLSNPMTDWNEVTPELTDGHATVKLDEQVMLSLPAIATEQSSEHPHQILAQWANNIRRVAGAKPLPLATAQEEMYNVTATAHAVRGYASWYGPYFHGRLTANGEIYDQYALTAAHRTLPLGTFVKVTNRNNGRSVVVRINDRGPYLDEDKRIIDLSYRAAQILDGEHKGIVPIDMVILEKQAEPMTPDTLQQTIALERR